MYSTVPVLYKKVRCSSAAELPLPKSFGKNDAGMGGSNCTATSTTTGTWVRIQQSLWLARQKIGNTGTHRR
jgi:hypothetical protein